MVAYKQASKTATPKQSDYNYIRLLTRSQMAWEYLRRNPDYRRDWRFSAPGRPSPIHWLENRFMCSPRARRYQFHHAKIQQHG